jgi:hypothetical protein
MFLKLLARGRFRPQQQVFQTKACEPFTTLQPAELIQFCGRPHPQHRDVVHVALTKDHQDAEDAEYRRSKDP